MEVIYIFDWLGDLIRGFGDAVGGAIGWVGKQVSSAIWEAMLQWYYETIYNAIADFFTMMGNMGAELFSLSWVQATVNLFVLFGQSLFAAGLVVAIFDVAIEYQCGRANIKTTAPNILKGFFACSMIGIVPVELYKFCITLQNSLAHDIAIITAAEQADDLGSTCSVLLQSCFGKGLSGFGILFTILSMIAFAYCVVKIFFANIKRGGILLIQIAVGARLYAFLTVGCVKISAVLFPTPSGMTFGCDIMVKDKPDSKEWICYDSIGEPFRYTALNLEQELFDILDKEVKAQGLSYTECNFEKLNGKTVNKTAAAL